MSLAPSKNAINATDNTAPAISFGISSNEYKSSRTLSWIWRGSNCSIIKIDLPPCVFVQHQKMRAGSHLDPSQLLVSVELSALLAAELPSLFVVVRDEQQWHGQGLDAHQGLLQVPEPQCV